MVNTNTLLSMIASIQSSQNMRDLTTPNLNDLFSVFSRLNVLLDLWMKQEASVVNNHTLSPLGQSQQLFKLMEQFAIEFKWFGNVLRENHKKYLILRKVLFALERTEVIVRRDLEQYFREREIRDLYRGGTGSSMNLDVAFTMASDKDDVETMFAFVDAPGGCMVSENMKVRTLDLRARRLKPEAYGNYQQTVLINECLVGIRGLLSSWIQGFGVKADVVEEIVGDDPMVGITEEEQKYLGLAKIKLPQEIPNVSLDEFFASMGIGVDGKETKVPPASNEAAAA